MKLCFPLCLLIVLFNGPCDGVAHAQVQPQTGLETKNILILHSHEASAPVFIGTDKGLLTALQSGGIPTLNQMFESLELRRYPYPEHRRLLVEQMRLRYSQRKLDMIVTMYPEALEFVLKDCQDIFPDVPILALYLPQGFELPKTDHRIIGHSVAFDIIETFEIALKLVPGAKRVYVVSGAHAVDKMIEGQARRDLKKWESHLEFHYLSHLHFEDILATLSSAPPDSIILLLVYSQDIDGRSYTTQNLTQQLSQVSTAPIFGLLDVALGYGIAGGSLINFESIGTKAGELVLNILRGTPATQNHPNTLDVPPMAMFDWRQLKRWNLSVDALPEGSTIQFYLPSLWERYRWYMAGGLGLITFQGCLIAALLLHRRQRALAERNLLQSEQRLRLITNALPVLIAYVDSDQRYQFNNDAYTAWFGISPKEAFGRTIREVIGETFYSSIIPYMQRALSGEHVRYAQDVVLKGGRKVSIEAIYVPDIDEKKSVRGFYVLVMDVTERNIAQQESKRLQDELMHASRITTMGELAGTLAHEINQPLSAIMSNAQAARRYLNAPTPELGEIQEILNDIVKEDARAGEVINRLRTLLKKSKTDFEPLDLNLIFKEVVRLLRSDVVIRDINLSTELDTRLPLVRGDRIQLQQVALNLILNAFEATNEQPRGQRRVLIRTWQKDSEILAAVSDNGSGIPAEETEEIFKPFYTTKPQGLGMGLSISRSIINRHQGRIWVENNSDGGAAFHFSFPVPTEERIVSRE
jgi:PAS domain S-box-containing protein